MFLFFYFLFITDLRHLVQNFVYLESFAQIEFARKLFIFYEDITLHCQNRKFAGTSKEHIQMKHQNSLEDQKLNIKRTTQKPQEFIWAFYILFFSFFDIAG